MSQFENIYAVEVSGNPMLPIPNGMTVERVLSTMQVDIDSYQQNVYTDAQGRQILKLSQSTGSKGNVMFRLINDKLVPMKPNNDGSFPTNEQLEVLVEEFPNDDFTQTLSNLTELKKYAAFLKDHQETKLRELLEAQTNELNELVANLSLELSDFKLAYTQNVYDEAETTSLKEKIDALLLELVNAKRRLILVRYAEVQQNNTSNDVNISIESIKATLAQEVGFESLPEL